MLYRYVADIIAVCHLGFALFAISGGLLCLRWRKTIWIHIPAVVLAALAEFTGWICPLTPMENWFRVKGGAAGYPGGFVEHYLLPVLYPAGLTRGVQLVLASLVIVCNVFVYWYVFAARKPKPVAPQ